MKTKSKTTKKSNPLKVGRIKIRSISKKKFDSMTSDQKRVAICKDVIARLDAQKIVEKRGWYLAPVDKKLESLIDYGRRIPYFSEPTPKELSGKSILDGGGKEFVQENKCMVCAKGALVLSWAANFNEVRVRDIHQHDGSEIDGLTDVFPTEYRDAMESAFEEEHWSLRQIMNWIIEKKGRFHFNCTIYGDDFEDRFFEDNNGCPIDPPKHLKK